MATEVLGIYDTRGAADNAAQALEQAGFSRSDITVEAYGAQSVGQKAEGGWEKLLEKLHLAAPKEDVQYYSQGLSPGQTVVTVTTTDDDADRAAGILDQYGALDIDDHSAQYHASQAVSTTAAYDTSAALNTSTAAANATNGEVIPVVEEELAVGKRQVRGGTARIYQRVTERPVEEQVTLHDEKVTIERRPVDRVATDADLSAMGERTIEVTETKEVPVVSKEARVVEEVVVGKTATDRTETVRDTVRRTDVEVDEVDEDVRTTPR